MKAALSVNPRGSWRCETPDQKRLAMVILDLPEYDESGRMIELNHFMLQCVRIPRNEPLSERKVMQMALNIGQLMSEAKLDNLDISMQILFKRFVALGMTELSGYIYQRG